MKKNSTKAVFLRGLKPELHTWLKEVAKKNGYTLSGMTNKVLEKAREQKWS